MSRLTVFERDPSLRARVAAYVVAGRPQSGKSTVCAMIAAILDCEWVESSSMVTGPIEDRLGLAPGTIAAARKIDPEHYRADMVIEADAMSAAGESPGLRCVRAGYRVIDGMRRTTEVESSKAEARARGEIPLVFFVINPANDERTNDNTQTDGLRAIADVVILNDDSIETLVERTRDALETALERVLTDAA